MSNEPPWKASRGGRKPDSWMRRGEHGGARLQYKDPGGRVTIAGIRDEGLPRELKSIDIKDRLRPGTAGGG
jgi:hypothetical protein